MWREEAGNRSPGADPLQGRASEDVWIMWSQGGAVRKVMHSALVSGSLHPMTASYPFRGMGESESGETPRLSSSQTLSCRRWPTGQWGGNSNWCIKQKALWGFLQRRVEWVVVTEPSWMSPERGRSYQQSRARRAEWTRSPLCSWEWSEVSQVVMTGSTLESVPNRVWNLAGLWWF